MPGQACEHCSLTRAPALQARKLELQLERLQADKRQISRELELTRDGLGRQEEKRKAEIAQLARDLEETNRDIALQERQTLEQLRKEDQQKTAAAEQRVREKEVELKKKMHQYEVLKDDFDILADTQEPMQATVDNLQSRLDAEFLVAQCVIAGMESNHDKKGLPELGRTALGKIRQLRQAAGMTELGTLVRSLLENELVKRAAVEAGASALTLSVANKNMNKRELIELIMLQKFSTSGLS